MASVDKGRWVKDDNLKKPFIGSVANKGRIRIRKRIRRPATRHVMLELHLYDSVDKDKVVFQRDPVLGNRLVQTRHTQVRHIGLEKTG
jgi:hypothetical protein